LKDGDMQDVMSNLLPMAQMGIPGLDISSIMQGGMPNLNNILQGLTPYLAMEGDLGDLYGDMGDLYNFGSDFMEDMYKYGMGGMSGMGGAQQQQLRRARLHNKLRRRRPSRLLKKTHTNRRLRKPREFPWYAVSSMFNGKQSGQSGSQSPVMPFFDGVDSEDLAGYLMMGGNRNSLPPPVDGIDTEDLWMYRGTQYDPMNYFNKATGKTTNSDGTPAKTTVNPWLWAFMSGLQKARMQKKF